MNSLANLRLTKINAITDKCITILHATNYKCSKIDPMDGKMKCRAADVRNRLCTIIHVVTRMKTSALDLLDSEITPDKFAIATQKLYDMLKEADEVLNSVRGAVESFKESFNGLEDEDQRKKIGVDNIRDVEALRAKVKGEVDKLAEHIKYL